jgi:hypothetical protein
MDLHSLELSRREAPDMNVELVEAGVVAVMSELNLELQLIALHGESTDGAGSADTRSAPCAVRTSGGELPRLDHCSGFLAENQLVGHLGTSNTQHLAVFVSGKKGNPDAKGRNASQLAPTNSPVEGKVGPPFATPAHSGGIQLHSTRFGCV